ncbi:hypothetical protein PLESTB_000545600 [Pleodorina starrii]|uniref:Mediator of RNA polymerase II transcription subunit 6 n=1 Tax=Pleodorina starrii TaxID=330485 RepID=A0A9W6F061_9CHLO|nr:hypothetical protein PLESTB_000545600 [Pleodorina starrii]GLC77078.1 hypothetical protein PLESTF_001881600 [Pleodorina starrii]GLC77703.1 hypothetical protein PLESTF_001978200 [Pleodorina starrii]
MDQIDQTGLQEFIPACASWFPLDRYKALAYFEQSSFFAAAGRDQNGQPVVINNTEARLAGLDPAVPGVLESFPHGRPEFILETAQEPNAFVIRKQMRTSANPLERPVVLAYYYIANNKIMQAPSAHQVTHARLQRCTFALQNGFARLQADLEPLTRQAKQLAKQAARDEQRQQQQQQKQQGQPQGQGPEDKAADGQGAGAAAAASGGGGGPLPPQQPQEPGRKADGAAAAAGPPYTWQAYGATVDLESPSLGTLRAPLAAPLPEVMAAAAAAAPAAAGSGGGGVPVRRHLTDADRARWNKLDRILSHQFSSLQRIKYTALSPEYLQRLQQQMYGPPPPAATAPPPATPVGGADAAAAAK